MKRYLKQLEHVAILFGDLLIRPASSVAELSPEQRGIERMALHIADATEKATIGRVS